MVQPMGSRGCSSALYTMKIFLLFICFGLTSQTSYSAQTPSIQYDSIKQYYEFAEQAISGHQLFSFLGLQSGLEIRFAPSLGQQNYTLPNRLTEQELIRWLASNLSLVQGFNKDQKLISLTLLPKGQLQSEQLIFANAPVSEGKSHQLGQTNTTAAQRFQLRVDELSQQEKFQLEQRIERNFEREKEASSRKAKRQARKDKEQQSLIDQLRASKISDPEMYARILELNKKRYPHLERAVNEL